MSLLLINEMGPTKPPKGRFTSNSPIIWLFFITFTLNLTVSLIALETNTVLRFLILMESHYKGFYLSSVFSLKQYLDSHLEKDYQEFRANLEPLLTYKKINDEANRPTFDYKKVSRLMDTLDYDSGDAFRFVLFFGSVRNLEVFKRNKQIMDQVSDLTTPLSSLGDELHRNLIKNAEDKVQKKEKEAQIKEINDRMAQLLTEFSDKISYLSRRITKITEITIIGVGFFLLTFGIYASRKIMEGSETYRNALEKSEARLRLSLEQMPASIWTTNTELKITSTSGAAMAEIPVDQGTLLGMPVKTFLKKWDLRNIGLEAHQKALQGESMNYDLEIFNRIWTTHVEPFRDEKGSITGVLGIAYDTTERKNQEISLMIEKERLLVTLRSIGDAVITTNQAGKVTLLNPVAEKLTGWSQIEAEANSLTEVFPVFNNITRMAIENPVSKVISTGQAVELADQTILKSKDGITRSIAASGAPIRSKDGKILGVVLVFRDITQEQKIQNELLKKMKLESLGMLAGGIAHDFNNILTAILGNVSLAKTELDAESPVNRYLEETEIATLKARDLSSQLLAFTKGGAPRRTITSITRLVEDSTRFVLRGSNIQSTFYMPDNLWQGVIDPGQISQVVHNLVINAQQANPGGGEIVIRAGNVMINEQHAKALILHPGPYVSISFKDNGNGIPLDLMSKVFDPFFTTKEKGSGLGLFMAYSIVKNHDGAITIESKVGLGTTVTIYLPAVTGNIPVEEDQKDEIILGSGRILLMDDDELVTTMASKMLQKLGYEVEIAFRGEEALEKYRQAKGNYLPFKAVIMDLTIPRGKGGKQTIQEMLAYDPDTRAIVSSGYSNDPIMSEFKKFGFKGCVAKPYRIQDLSKVLNQVLQS